MTPDERTRLAYHEGMHALAAVAQNVPIVGASLRPGKGFAAATFLGREGEYERDPLEARIIVTLSGRVGEMMAEQVPLELRPPDEKVAHRKAARDLKRRSPATFERMVRAEASDDNESDAASSYRRSLAFCDYDEQVTQAHLNYLRYRAVRLGDNHPWALRAIAAGLYQFTTLTGDEIYAMAAAHRCGCHDEWGPPSASAPGTSKA